MSVCRRELGGIQPPQLPSNSHPALPSETNTDTGINPTCLF